MIRAAFILFLVSAVAVATLALMGEPGRAHLDWMGWRVEMTAAAAALLKSLAATVGGSLCSRDTAQLSEASARSISLTAHSY